jgi:hypothetical protein
MLPIRASAGSAPAVIQPGRAHGISSWRHTAIRGHVGFRGIRYANNIHRPGCPPLTSPTA